MSNTILVTTSSFGKYDQAPLNKLEQLGYKVQLNPFHRKLTESEVKTLVNKYSPIGMIAGVEPLTREVLGSGKSIIAISRCGIGLDSVDLIAARDFGIIVTNTPEGPTLAVAELTIGLIITLLRRVHLSDHSIRQGKWVRPMGGLLSGKTVGIVGCGRIGTHTAKLLAPFGCKILGSDPLVQDCQWCQIHHFEELIGQADIISLHIPYTEKNHHLFNRETIGQCQKGAILINASRGGLIDEVALLEALKNGQLGGAALDCYEQEPYIGPLVNLDNVLLTGHIGSYAREGRIMMEMQSVDNLLNEIKKRLGSI